MKRIYRLIVQLTIVSCFGAFYGSELSAAELQKVILLTFQNIEKDPNYEYLEASITDAIREKIKAKFAFEETPEKLWKSVARKNFLIDADSYTATYGLNLGMYANQDVVINGGFLISGSQNDVSMISTTIRIISVSEKSVLSEVTVNIPADSRLFQTINEVADKAALEAARVLPNKEDWEKTRSAKKVAKKLFARMEIGIRGGGNFYFNGWANQIQTKLPSFGGIFRAHMPILAEAFFIQAEYTYYQHELLEDSVSQLAASGITLLTSNHVVGGSVGYDFPLGEIFLLSPRLGGGAIFQSTQISGAISQTVSNTVPCVSAGADLTWLATDSLKIVLDLSFNTQIEHSVLQNTSIFTFSPAAQLGVNIGF